jgi:hypothetical protein
VRVRASACESVRVRVKNKEKKEKSQCNVKTSKYVTQQPNTWELLTMKRPSTTTMFP